MKFGEFVENEDGTATTQVELSKEETQMLVEYALVHILKNYIQSEDYLHGRCKCGECTEDAAQPNAGGTE